MSPIAPNEAHQPVLIYGLAGGGILVVIGALVRLTALGLTGSRR